MGRLGLRMRTGSFVLDLIGYLVLSLSIIFNLVILASLLYRMTGREIGSKCPNTKLAKLKRQQELERLLDVTYPDDTGKLSHVVIPLMNRVEELSQLEEALKHWTKNPPCLHNSYPSNWSEAFVTLVFLLESSPSREFTDELTAIYNKLPTSARACFASIEVRHAGLEHVSVEALQRAKRLAKQEETVDPTAATERSMFAKLLNNNLDLKDPRYVLLYGIDTIPVQPNWLNYIDYETRPPIERFWVKGSIFRGSPVPEGYLKGISEATISNIIHMSRTAIYNVGDPTLGHFYVKVVLPWLESEPLWTRNSAPNYDIPRFLFRRAHYAFSREMAVFFRFTNVIQDHSGCTFSAEEMITAEPATVLVTGNFTKIN